jgi:hypothetical protein
VVFRFFAKNSFVLESGAKVFWAKKQTSRKNAKYRQKTKTEGR